MESLVIGGNVFCRMLQCMLTHTWTHTWTSRNPEKGRSNLERDIMTCSLSCSITFEAPMYVRSVVVLWVGFA